MAEESQQDECETEEVERFVAVQWRDAFRHFVSTGEASEQFLEYLEADSDCQKAAELAFAAQAATLAIPRGSISRRKRRSWGFWMGEVTEDAISATLPAFAIVCLILVYRWWFPPDVGELTKVAVQTLSFDRAFKPVLGALVLSVLISVAVGRTRLGHLRHSAGALIGGVLIAFAILKIWTTEPTESLSIQLASDQAQAQALDLLITRWATGRFPQPTDAARTMVTTASISGDHAIYRVSASELPGTLVAELNRDAGNLYFEYGDKRELRGQFVVGEIQSINGEDVRIVDLEGRPQIVKVPQVAALAEGSHVAVVLDANRRVTLIRDLEICKPIR